MAKAEAQFALVRELLGHLDGLLQRAYDRARPMFERKEAGEPRPWAYRGMYVSQEEVEQHLAAEPLAVSLSATVENPALMDVFGRTPLWGSYGQWLGLTPFDVAVTLLALAPELESRYGRLYAYLQDDVARRHPTVGLALDVFAESSDAKLLARPRFLPGAPLLRGGLIQLIADPNQLCPTLLDYTLKLDDRAVIHLLGDTSLAPAAKGLCEVSEPGERALMEEQSDLSGLVPMLIDARRYFRCLPLYFQGAKGHGQRQTASALASAVRAPLINADLALLSVPRERCVQQLTTVLREAIFREGFVYLEGLDALSGEDMRECRRAVMRALSEHPGVVILCGAQVWTHVPGTLDGVLVVPFAPLGHVARRTAWRDALRRANIPDDERTLDVLSSRHQLSLDQISSAVASASTRIRWSADRPSGRASGVVDELLFSAQAQSTVAVSSLLRRIEPERTWDDLVLPQGIKRELRELCQRVERRSQVLDDWGFARKLSHTRGISALFSGASGTGKTLAAEVIARELGLSLYKVDLSQVVSKYIGETEKNLELVFGSAERSNAILFFDEADALFGKRSEIHDAHDRYANVEVGYLLQRMEQYEGIAILATNLSGNLDDAFVRRLAFCVRFPFPDEAQRREIWRKAWPEADVLAADVDLDRLAAQFKLSGGNIRNIVLAAAFLAASEGTAVSTAMLLRALSREYKKVGQHVSEEELTARLDASAEKGQVRC